MIINHNLSDEIIKEWFLLPYYERVKFFDKLRSLTECASYVRLCYGHLGFYTDYGELNCDDPIIAKVYYEDLHLKDMSLQYQALAFISCLDMHLSNK